VCTASAASDQRVAHGAFSRHTPPLAAPHTEPPASARAAEWRRPPSTRVPTNRPLNRQAENLCHRASLGVEQPMPRICVRLTPLPQVFRHPHAAGLLEETQSTLTEVAQDVSGASVRLLALAWASALCHLQHRDIGSEPQCLKVTVAPLPWVRPWYLPEKQSSGCAACALLCEE
jgi:hypothetical protein